MDADCRFQASIFWHRQLFINVYIIKFGNILFLYPQGPFGRIKPDQMQALNPILIIAFIPLFEVLVYPCLERINVPSR